MELTKNSNCMEIRKIQIEDIVISAPILALCVMRGRPSSSADFKKIRLKDLCNLTEV